MDTESHFPRGARRPSRKHAQERFELLLDTTEALLAEQPGENLSLADIAQRSGVPLASIYHFFPNRNAALVALAQRFHSHFKYLATQPHVVAPHNWQAFVAAVQRRVADYLNSHPAALRLLMGAGVSAEVRNADVHGNSVLSKIRAEQFRRYFEMPRIPDLELRVAVAIAIQDGIWALSYGTHGSITDDFVQESTRAAVCYLRSFLPDELPRRDDLPHA